MTRLGVALAAAVAASVFGLTSVPLWGAPATTQPADRPGGGPPRLEDLNIYLVLKDGNRLIGELAHYDARAVTVRDRTGQLRSAPWDQLLPTGSYHLQKRLTDPNSAEVNFRLGYFCLAHGLRQDAQDHLNKARELDPSYAARVRSLYLGEYRQRVDMAISLNDPRELAELERRPALGIDIGQPRPARMPERVVSHRGFSDAAHIRALEQIRRFGERTNARLGTSLRSFETEHYVIFTDWPEAEDGPLGQMFETIYTRLCRQFDVPPSRNIFLGKLPVFCWARRDDFVRFANELDHFPLRETTTAYVMGTLSGYQHMALYRYPNRLLLEKIVAHEGVHTFMHNYRSNVPLVAWLNEGLAEVMSGIIVPRARVIERARSVTRDAVRRGVDVLALLNSGYAVPNVQQYALSTTLVDYLMRKDSSRFLDLINRIKGGTKTEAALQAVYGLDYPALADAWRKWVVAGFPPP